MEIIKKNVFWIAIGVVLLAGVGFYLSQSVVSADGKTTAELKQASEAQASAIQGLANNKTPDGIKTDKHVAAAKAYKTKLEAELKGARERVESMAVNLTQDAAFKDVLAIDKDDKFDVWLGDVRKQFQDQLAKAGLRVPAPDTKEAKLLFLTDPTRDGSTEFTDRKGYRIRHMAILQEVLKALCKDYGKLKIVRFGPKKEEAEPPGDAEGRALAIEKFVVLPPASPDNKTPERTADHRQKVWTEDGYGRSNVARNFDKAPPGLPYTITSVDVVFEAPLEILPAVAQELETSTRYTAVLTRIDYQRIVLSPYPDPKLAQGFEKAGAIPRVNTHYQEAPVRALVSFDIYEYDKAKEERLKADAAKPKGAAPVKPPPPPKPN